MKNFSPYPFDFTCAECGAIKSIYSSYGFIKETENVRDRQRLCSPECFKKKARKLKKSEGINEYALAGYGKRSRKTS